MRWFFNFVDEHGKKTSLTAAGLSGKSRREQVRILYEEANALGTGATELYIRGQTNVWVANHYIQYMPREPDLFDFSVTLFSIDPKRDYFWDRVTSGQVSIFKASGYHYEILDRPHVCQIAHRLQSTFSEVFSLRG